MKTVHLIALCAIALGGCASSPKYDEPQKPADNASTSSSQPVETQPGQFGVRSDRADEPK